jgi:homoserine kinase
MAGFVDGPVRVTVPATSANLGPGFDSLGLALAQRDELSAEVTGSGLEIEVSGAGADDVPRDESHLVVRSMRAGFAAMELDPAGLRLVCHNRIPHSRGLGSSSAAIVAGLALARALVTGGDTLLDDHELFALAADIEGHPDNVAPALHGGLVISGSEDGRFFSVPVTVDARVSGVVFVPPTPVQTSVARGLLPETVPHADAAANSGRTALLIAALSGKPDLLPLATRDYLHQDYREPAMPESLALVRALRADGHAALVSGAGPTVLVLIDGPAGPLLARCPDGWEAHHLAIDLDGVTAG